MPVTEPVIEVRNLHKRYGDTVAVDDVSFSVEPGEIFGILGPNGAGKTTTVETIAGLRPRDGGTVSVLGLDPGRDAAALRPRLGVQLQESSLADRITVREALDMFASFYPSPADPAELIDAFGLAGRAGTQFRRLSGGQKQRLSVALALIGRPEVAVLDELTTGLDPQARRDAWQVVRDVRDRGVTILLVTHFMEEAERLCDRIALIDGGRVTALGTPAGLARGTEGAHRMRFLVPAGTGDGVLDGLSDLAEVTAVQRLGGGRVEVAGGRAVVAAVIVALDRHGILPLDVETERASLDDVFLTLTGGRAATGSPTTPTATDGEGALT